MSRRNLAIALSITLACGILAGAQAPTNVLNPASDLAGKTLVTAEGNRTISGTFTYSVPVLFANGTINNPGMAASADNSTGIGMTAGQIRMSLAGTQRFRLNATGLQVYGTTIVDNAGVLQVTNFTPPITAGATDGQFLIGRSSDGKLVLGTLTAGNGIAVSNGSGSSTVAASSYVLDRQVTLQTVVNTGVETSVYTFSVPGNTLSTNKTIRVSGIGDVKDNAAGGPHTWTVRVKYGATTFATDVITNGAASANRGAMLFEFELTAANATNVQKSKMNLWLSDGNVNNATGTHNVTVGTYSGGMAHNVFSTGAEDSTAAKNLVVTFANSIADANMDMRLHTIYTELK